jgi:hypothetical protein
MKFKNRFIYKEARLHILLHYWDLRLAALESDANQKDSPAM